MKILFYEPFSTGHRVQYCIDFLNSLAVEKGFDIGLFVPCEFDTQQLSKKIKIYKIISDKFDRRNVLKVNIYHIKNLIKAKYIIEKDNYDALHILYGDIFRISTYAILYLLHIRKIIMMTLHWSKTDNNSKNIAYIFYKTLEKAFTRLLINMVSMTFVHGEKIKDDLIDNIGPSVDPKITVIPYPVSPVNLKFFNKEMSRNKLGLPLNTLLFLSFGGLRYEKGADLLIEAIRYVGNKSNFKVIIAGQPQDFSKDYITAKINDYQLNEKFILRLEYISDEDICDYFAACDAVVLPYRDNFYGQSGPFTFAIKFGKPSMAFDVSQVGYDIKMYSLGYAIPKNDIKKFAAYLSVLEKRLRTDKLYLDKIYNGVQEYLADHSLASLIKKYTSVVGNL